MANEGQPSGSAAEGHDARQNGAGVPQPAPARRRSEPAFFLPVSVTAMIAILVGIHLIRAGLPFRTDFEVLAWFAFIPARYANVWAAFPGGYAADAWTFVTYAFLHGSVMHLVMNCVWLVAFGSAVARRFGGLRFWVFSAAAAAGGAAMHLVFHAGEAIPVVGASAAIAGQMAAAARFVFDSDGPLVLGPRAGEAAYKRAARSLRETFANRRALAFIIIWFAINLAVGLGSNVAGGVSIAWEAHVGGFLVGLVAFRLFDPVRRWPNRSQSR